MALQIPSYEDSFGNAYDASYWRLVQCNISIPDRGAYLLFYGYKDANARTAGKLNVGQKHYHVTGDTFDALMAQHLEPDGPNIAVMAYLHAKTTQDTPDGTDEDGNPTLKSFFHGSQDVL